MKSEDLNNWKDNELYCISEHDENEESNEEDSKIMKLQARIPEETIEFKKILYMLDSGGQTKKRQDRPLSELSSSNSKKLFSNNSIESSVNRS